MDGLYVTTGNGRHVAVMPTSKGWSAYKSGSSRQTIAVGHWAPLSTRTQRHATISGSLLPISRL
jgi:hypothetical protein